MFKLALVDLSGHSLNAKKPLSIAPSIVSATVGSNSASSAAFRRAWYSISETSAGPDDYFRGDALHRLTQPCYSLEGPVADGILLICLRVEISVFINAGYLDFHLLMRKLQIPLTCPRCTIRVSVSNHQHTHEY